MGVRSPALCPPLCSGDVIASGLYYDQDIHCTVAQSVPVPFNLFKTFAS